MFRPAPLWHVIAIFPKKFQKEILEELGKEGLAEIRKSPERLEKSPYFRMVEAETGEVAKVLMSVDREISRLGIKTGKPQKERENPIEETQSLLEELKSEEEGLNSILQSEKGQRERLKKKLEMVRSLRELKLEGKPQIHMAVMEPKRWESAHKKIESTVEKFTVLREAVGVNKELIAIISEKKDFKRIKTAYPAFTSGSIEDVAEKLENDIEKIDGSIEGREGKLKGLSEEYGSRLLGLREQLEFMLKRENERKKLVQSKFSSTLSCWVSKKDYPALKNLFWRVCGPHVAFFIEEPKPEEAPTKLENILPFKPFELFLYKFSLPSYNEIDPTPIIALIFPLFFGLMLSDGGYGALLLLMGLVARRRKGMDAFGNILLYCAISTILFGFVFGSWFGYPLTAPHLDPLRKPLVLMGVTLAIGFAYVNLGLLLGVAQRWIKKDWNGLAEEEGLWILFQLGIGALLLKEWIIGSLLVGGTVLFRIVRKGVLKILDFPKLFSTFISFVRLAALAMATGWIAFTVNLLFNAVKSIQYGLILGIPILIVGHLFNFGFNAFGAFLQAMRLHYVEFLGQFFEGEGTPMKIFKLTREHTLEVK